MYHRQIKNQAGQPQASPGCQPRFGGRLPCEGGQLAWFSLLWGLPTMARKSSYWGAVDMGGVNRQAIARAINLHKSQEQRQNLSRS